MPLGAPYHDLWSSPEAYRAPELSAQLRVGGGGSGLGDEPGGGEEAAGAVVGSVWDLSFGVVLVLQWFVDDIDLIHLLVSLKLLYGFDMV